MLDKQSKFRKGVIWEYNSNCTHIGFVPGIICTMPDYEERFEDEEFDADFAN